jgi:uroporphyrinogen decarboxylase
MYRDYVLPLHRELFDYIHSLGAAVKLHICGNITHLLPHLAETGADIIDLDWMVDPEEAHRALGGAAALSGNLNPVAMIRDRSADEVYAAARALVERERGEKFILSGGCEITVDTPRGNVTALRRAAG